MQSIIGLLFVIYYQIIGNILPDILFCHRQPIVPAVPLSIRTAPDDCTGWLAVASIPGTDVLSSPGCCFNPSPGCLWAFTGRNSGRCCASGSAQTDIRPGCQLYPATEPDDCPPDGAVLPLSAQTFYRPRMAVCRYTGVIVPGAVPSIPAQTAYRPPGCSLSILYRAGQLHRMAVCRYTGVIVPDAAVHQDRHRRSIVPGCPSPSSQSRTIVPDGCL